MTNANLIDAMGCIDPKLIADAAPDVPQKKSSHKPLAIVVAACLTLVCLIMPISISRYNSSFINIESNVGNISLRYVPKWEIRDGENNSDLLPYFTEFELFNNAEYIFSGTIESIKQIEMNFDGTRVYKSLITVTVDEKYKGDCPDTIVIMGAPIGIWESTNNDLLYSLEKETYGIFMTDAVLQGEMLSENNCSFDASQICNARIGDGVRFGFIKGENDSIIYDKQAYPTLDKDTWNDAVEYVKKMVS